MRHLQNLHTHSLFCDGVDSPEEIILTAIDKGFESIGFSSHSYMPSLTSAQESKRLKDYKTEILRLKEKYINQIKIYLGLEVEMDKKTDIAGYDYSIGSIHYLMCSGEFIAFDCGQTEVEALIKQHFGGDGLKYAKAYYSALALLPQYGDFDVIGHFDLITKHSDNIEFFDASSKEYLFAAFEAAEALKGKIHLFELSTGPMARGYLKTPYPSVPIIKELKRLGFGAVITSDCHNKNMLDYNFNEAEELLRCCGYKEKYIFTDQGFQAIPIC